MKKFIFYVLLFYLFFRIEGVAKENFYEEAKKKFPDGWKAPKPYLRIVRQPK